MTQLLTLVEERPIATSILDPTAGPQGTIPSSILQLLFDTLQFGLAIVDENGTLVGHNAAWTNFIVSNLPDTSAFALSSNVVDACRFHARAAAFEPLAVATGLEGILKRSIPEFRTEYSVGTGPHALTYEIRGFACEQNSSRCILLSHEDITARKKAERAAIDAAERLHMANHELELLNGRLERLASIDELTGLLNRRAFERTLTATWEESNRDGLPMALVLFDVDCFKQYNDSCGHPAGDTCLQAIARTLARTIIGTGLRAARYGGEEFAVILPDTGIERSWEFAQSFREQIDTLGLLHPGSNVAPHVTVSGGCGAKTSAADTLHEILYRTDTALYAAKRGGRNRICRQPDSGAA